MKFKQAICYMLSLILTFGLCTQSTLAISINNDSEMQDILQLIGVYQAGNKDMKQTVTRAQMVDYALKLSGITTEGLSGGAVFADVPSEHPYAGAIDMAVANKIISPSTLFLPDETVTVVQAVKMLMSTLGYDTYAMANGGYPVGYLSAAKSVGVTYGVKVSDKDVLTFDTLTRLLFQTLHADVMKAVSLGSYVEYEAKKGNSLLYDVYGITRERGILEQTQVGSLNSEEMLSNGRVRLNQIVYDTASQVNYGDLCELLGYSVAYYTKEVEGEQILLYYVEDKNEVTSVFSEEVTGFADGRLYYMQNNKKCSIAISPKAAIVYNGRAVTSGFSDSLFEADYGTVQLIDAGNTGDINTVKIKAYDNYVVGAIDKNQWTVYDAYTQGKKLVVGEDGKQKENVRLLSKTGNPQTFENVTQDSVLSVAMGLDGMNADIIIVNEKVSGTVLSVMQKDDGEIDSVFVDGNEYKVAPNINSERVLKLKVGQNYVFGLDAGGRVASVKSGNTIAGGSVFLIDAQKLTDGVQNGMQLKIMDQIGEKVIINMAEKVKIDGNIITTPEMMLSALSVDGYVKSQPIEITVNEEGEVTGVDTPKLGINEDKNDSLQLIYSSKGARILYKSTPKVFMSFLGVDGNVKAFLHPKDSAKKAVDEEYDATGISYFKNDSSYIIEAYAKTPESASASIVSVEGAKNSSINDQAFIMLVDKVINEYVDDENHNVISGFYGGKEAKFVLDEESVLNLPKKDAPGEYITVGKGDAIRFGLNNKGNVNSIQMLYDFSEQMPYIDGSQMDTHAIFQAVTGPVYRYESKFITLYNKIDLNDKDIQKRVFTGSGFQIYVVEGTLSKPIIRKGTVSDIRDIYTYGEDYSTALLQMRYYDPRTMILYQKLDK